LLARARMTGEGMGTLTMPAQERTGAIGTSATGSAEPVLSVSSLSGEVVLRTL